MSEPRNFRLASFGRENDGTPFKQTAEGTTEFDAHFKVTWQDKSTAEFRFTFQVTVVGKLKVELGQADVDLDGQSLAFRANRGVQKAEVVVWGEGAQPLGRRGDLNGASGSA